MEVWNSSYNLFLCFMESLTGFSFTIILVYLILYVFSSFQVYVFCAPYTILHLDSWHASIMKKSNEYDAVSKSPFQRFDSNRFAQYQKINNWICFAGKFTKKLEYNCWLPFVFHWVPSHPCVPSNYPFSSIHSFDSLYSVSPPPLHTHDVSPVHVCVYPSLCMMGF